MRVEPGALWAQWVLPSALLYHYKNCVKPPQVGDSGPLTAPNPVYPLYNEKDFCGHNWAFSYAFL